VISLRRRVVHFIFGLRPQTEPFHLLHYLSIASCQQVIGPDEIQLHVHHLPFGVYWDLVRPLVTLHRIEPIAAVAQRRSPAEFEPYAYAHHADVIRLDLLAERGGMYADIDTLFIRPVPDSFWQADALIGHEHEVDYGDGDGPEGSLTNALIMAQPGAPFITTWRDQIIDAMDGTWSGHSCRLATRIASRHPDIVTIEPLTSFSPFAHTIEGMHALLEEPFDAKALERTYSVHLCAHLWWAHDRRDFSMVSANEVSEQTIREVDTNLTGLARPFLPSHGLF
jgi:hypothetical protein